ncbi:CPBP family intramembrane glutamic endopeptidase [Paenibacillus solisilvae]|uniref:CPBP family intramembrane glutamic endopeptidase n=1 Tax=Paenibacillus solisilvae TaxID=2486751 RepID=A0ABW0W5W9_9BACL
MKLNRIQPNWRNYSWLAAIGAIIYVLIQIVPSTAESFFGTSSDPVISKSSAEQAALDFAKLQFKERPLSVHAIHQSDSLLFGYLSKEKLNSSYEKKFDKAFPIDTFQVLADMPDGSELFMYVHMQQGNVVSWNKLGEAAAAEPVKKEEASAAAIAFAVSKGFKKSELELVKAAGSELLFHVKGYSLGQSQLVLKMRSEKLTGGSFIITEYKPQFTVPASYESYVNQQKKLASWLSLIGNSLLSFALFVLAIIYAAQYRRHTSFVRGIVLSLLFLAIYLVNDFNMMDGLLATYGENTNSSAQALFALIITLVITGVLAISVYFSLVGGDGLWRSMGANLWPRFGETGYGDHVWRSMWLGYLIAFMLLGLQTVIFIILMQATGAWSTSDVSQSPYNLAAPWIFPLMAWCAAISEEAVYRLFGIGLMKKWFKNTFVASLIPTIIWALGHVTYPIFPSTTRLLELTIIGLIFSFMFIRFGFIAVVFAHAVFDSIMMAISLMFMGTAGNILLGIVYILLPIPIAWIIRWFSCKFPRRERAV